MRIPLLGLFVSVLVFPIAANAQWFEHGSPVSIQYGSQLNVQAIPDGVGGVFVCYQEFKDSEHDIFMQRLDANGNQMWGPNGVPVCTAANDQYAPKLVLDRAGGAIVTWEDYRLGTFDIYAQRIDASGTVQWAANGVAVCTAANSQREPNITTDGAGGAIIAWYDARTGIFDIYTQRVTSTGTMAWAANGVLVCGAANNQTLAIVGPDGENGAVIAWADERAGNADIYIQRINFLGAPVWAGNGVPLSTAPGDQYYPAMLADGMGGATVVWVDYQGNTNIYGQRVNASGTPQWGTNGAAICTAPNAQLDPVIVSDGSGGAFVAWEDFRSGVDLDIYAQRITSNASNIWALNGVQLVSSSGGQSDPTLAGDDDGGVVVAWEDDRVPGNPDVYAQRVSALGFVQWQSNGVRLTGAPGGQYSPVLVRDENGGAIAAWVDYRPGSTSDLYAQRVEFRYGYWGRPEPAITAAYDNPGDQGGSVVLNWNASGRDVLNQQTIYQYTIWRALDMSASAANLSAEGWKVIDAPVTRDIPEGTRVVWREVNAAAEYYWELVGSQTAYYYPSYSFVADTRQDSTETDPAVHYFRIAAEGYSQFLNWPSNVISAYSVDNLAPSAPLMLAAQRVGPDVHLDWNGVVVPDLKNYAVYRADATGVTPIPGNFLSTETDTMLVDANAPAGGLYYIVTALDIHDNESVPSNEASVSPVTNVGSRPPIASLTVMQNFPNPFSRETTLEIGLPAAGPISVDVYDVAGRRVRSLEVSGEKGWQQVPIAGINDRGQPLASGVYFYKVRANGTTLTRKMLITR